MVFAVYGRARARPEGAAGRRRGRLRHSARPRPARRGRRRRCGPARGAGRRKPSGVGSSSPRAARRGPGGLPARALGGRDARRQVAEAHPDVEAEAQEHGLDDRVRRRVVRPPSPAGACGHGRRPGQQVARRSLAPPGEEAHRRRPQPEPAPPPPVAQVVQRLAPRSREVRDLVVAEARPRRSIASASVEVGRLLVVVGPRQRARQFTFSPIGVPGSGVYA